MLQLVCVPQAAAGSVHTYGAQALSGHRLLFFPVSLLWLSSLSRACCSLDVKAAYTAVYDRYPSQSATFLFFFARSADNWLLRFFISFSFFLYRERGVGW